MKELETPRLKLRKITRDDIHDIFANWASDPEVTRYLTWKPHRSERDTLEIMDFWLNEYDLGISYRWGIELKEDGSLIGMIDVVGYTEKREPVIGYCEGRKWWGCGYMTETLKAVTEGLFDEGFDSLFIEAVSDNTSSCRVIEKAGFEYVGSRIAPLSFIKQDNLVKINSYRIIKK